MFRAAVVIACLLGQPLIASAGPLYINFGLPGDGWWRWDEAGIFATHSASSVSNESTAGWFSAGAGLTVIGGDLLSVIDSVGETEYRYSSAELRIEGSLREFLFLPGGGFEWGPWVDGFFVAPIPEFSFTVRDGIGFPLGTVNEMIPFGAGLLDPAWATLLDAPSQKTLPGLLPLYGDWVRANPTVGGSIEWWQNEVTVAFDPTVPEPSVLGLVLLSAPLVLRRFPRRSR